MGWDMKNIGRFPKENVYVCEYGCVNVTVDVDEGVTPFMMKCRRKPTPQRPIARKFLGDDGECIGTAYSRMYPRGPKPPNVGEATHEWYRPTPNEIEDNKFSRGELEHISKGGLLLRERTDREPVYHLEAKP